MPLISTLWATLICPLEINDSINCRTPATCCCICSGERDAKRSLVVLIKNRKYFICDETTNDCERSGSPCADFSLQRTQASSAFLAVTYFSLVLRRRPSGVWCLTYQASSVGLRRSF